MKTKHALLFVLCLLSINLFAQDYFQQEVNYTIEVRLDDKRNELFATVTIQYINNSQNTLDTIFLHLWVNGYKNDKTALCKQMVGYGNTLLSNNYQTIGGYVNELDFKVNEQNVEWDFDDNYIDICYIALNEPISTGDTIVITTPFHVKIPSNEISRMGCDAESYQITQWYPKPAVYDINGWNTMPYLDYGEYYSEFGSFDVSITLPKQYVVGATGNLKTNPEINWVNKLAKEKKQGKDLENPSEEENKTIRFTENNIHDFAWFANKNFYVDKSSVELPHSGKKVTTWALYTANKTELWEKATEYVNDAVYYTSLWVGDYPYKNCTAVDGGLRAGGGMEYPTITVISSGWNAFSLETVIVHEVIHNWFYGIFGFNERDFPFLDEGLTTFYETRSIMAKYPKKLYSTARKLPYHYEGYKSYTARVNSLDDFPLNTKTTDMGRWTYYSVSYGKSAHSFWYLMKFLGEEEFDRIMQLLFNNWKYKHPQPNDLHKHFQENANKNIDWFFNDVVKTTKTMDYSAVKIKGKKLLVKNKGELNSPISITGFLKNEKVFEFWKDGFNEQKWLELPTDEFDKIVINYNFNTLDINSKNNSIKK